MAMDGNFYIFVSLKDDDLYHSYNIRLEVKLSYHSSDPPVGEGFRIPEASRDSSLGDLFPSPPRMRDVLSDGGVVPFPLERLNWIDPRDGAATPLEDVAALASRMASEAETAQEENRALVLKIEKKVVMGESDEGYKVFVSFRGADTRVGFVSHLYAAFVRMGISCFADDEMLERDEPIWQAQLKAIESSSFAVVVFSENYANSRWCLEELVKILQCRREMGQRVLPIFYHVEPLNVRGHTALSNTQVEEDLQRWRAALTEASQIPGWSCNVGRPEAQLVEEIATFISMN